MPSGGGIHAINRAEARAKQSKKEVERCKKELDSKEADREKIIDRIVDTDDPDLRKSYETRLLKIRHEEKLLEEKLMTWDKPAADFEEMFEPAMQFLARPYEIWMNGDETWRRALLRVVFASKVKCCPEIGLRTAELSLASRLVPRQAKGFVLSAFFERATTEWFLLSTPSPEVVTAAAPGIAIRPAI